jgi:ABC-type transport system involved in cytochrome c biogenesis permease subunit
MRFRCAAAGLLLLAACGGRKDPRGFDFGPISEVVILHQGRQKTLDTLGRELIHLLSGREQFQRFKDEDGKFPALKDGKYARVFPSAEPVESLLRLSAQPAVYKDRPFIKIQHPEVKERFGLDRGRDYYSPEELAKVSTEMEKTLQEARSKEDHDRGPFERTVGQIAEQAGHFRFIRDHVIFQIVPLPYGARERWPSIADLEGFLEAPELPETQDPEVNAFLKAVRSVERPRLQGLVDAWKGMLAALAADKVDDFNKASLELRDRQRALNPSGILSSGKVAVELQYHRSRPFTQAWRYGYGPSMLVFLLAFAFSSRRFRWAAILIFSLGAALHLQGYWLRWQIAARYPLSNMYESMIAMGLFLGLIGIVMELVMKSNLFGFCSALLATLCVLMAEEITIFSPFVSQLQPALLNQVLMTIHVPAIMAAYGTGFLCTGIGVAYILTYLISPGRTERLEHLDLCLYRILQITVLLLIGGVALGAVWAGEAWGRYWGWDMKEVWALITLLWYLAMLHSRFTGWVKGLLLANASLWGFIIIMLTYVGVNILFGKGLHTYGFVLGATWVPLLVVFAGLGVLNVLSLVAWLKRRDGKARSPQEVAR